MSKIIQTSDRRSDFRAGEVYACGTFRKPQTERNYACGKFRNVCAVKNYSCGYSRKVRAAGNIPAESSAAFPPAKTVFAELPAKILFGEIYCNKINPKLKTQGELP